jgi:ribosomal protein L32
MAVQQNKKSPSKRGMHRAHDFLTAPPLAVEPTTAKFTCATTSRRPACIAARRW